MARISVKIAADSSELIKLQAEAKKFSSKFQGALAITSGVGAFAGLAGGLDMLKEGFVDVIKQGVEFNALLEQSKIGVAAVLRQFNPDEFKTFDAAMTASGEAIDMLKEKALKSPATFRDLAGAFQGLSGAATAGGLDLKQQVDMVVLMSQTMAGLGLRSDELMHESRALLTGDIREDTKAAKILGITKAQIEAAKSTGTLNDFLTKKMSGFKEAATVGAQSYTTVVSNMHDATEQLYAELSQPIFDEIKKSVIALNGELTSTDFKAALRPLFEDAAVAVHVFAELALWTAKNAGTISEVARAVMTLGTAYGALRIGQWLVALAREALALQAATAALGQEAAAHGTNAAAIDAETTAVELNLRAKARAAAVSQTLMGGAGGGALMGPGQLMLPASQSIVPAGGRISPAAARSGFSPMLLGDGRNVVIELESTVNRVERSGRSAMNSMTGMFSKVGTWSKETAVAAGKMAAANPFAVLATAMAGWEIGKALRRPIYGHNGDEDLAKGDDYNSDFNKKQLGFNAQLKAVSTVAEKNQLVNDLMEARAGIEEKLAKETAPLLREELSVQLKTLDLMADAAGRVNWRMMEAAKVRNKAAADKSRKEQVARQNVDDYEEGRKTFGKTSIEALQDGIDKLKGDDGSVDEQTRKYEALNRKIDGAKQAPEVDSTQLDQAQAAVNAAKGNLSAEMGKGETITSYAGAEGFGGDYSTPNGDVEGAQKALKAAEAKRDALKKTHEAEVAARESAERGDTAEAERLRKNIEQIKEKQKALDELEKAKKRSEEMVQIAGLEADGDFAGAHKIKKQQAREDMEGQLKSSGHSDDEVERLLARFDAATANNEGETQARSRDQLRQGEQEAAGDYHGAQQGKRALELQDYRKTLGEQGFEPADIEAMVKRQAALQGADQAKALQRYNLSQKAMELRADGKGEEAQKYELAAKRDQMVEENQKNFGVDPETAAAMADKRLGTEIQGQRSITASSAQKIGGGGGFSGNTKDPAQLLEDIRGILKDIKDHTKPEAETTFGSETAPWLSHGY